MPALNTLLLPASTLQNGLDLPLVSGNLAPENIGIHCMESLITGNSEG